MEEAEVEPDAITFVGVLCACVQTNDVKGGYRYFTHLRKRYGITPTQEHYTCMIELYTRANMSNELRELVNAGTEGINA
uniref:Pentatricopeptide repeat-containing protein n=1 Tax=Rhizophora mucronata TaxID=61149 RepID=A0A2P2Q3F5_RHIMU